MALTPAGSRARRPVNGHFGTLRGSVTLMRTPDARRVANTRLWRLRPGCSIASTLAVLPHDILIHVHGSNASALFCFSFLFVLGASSIAMVLSKFDSLSVRPPTPPKDLQEAGADETLQFLQDPFDEKPIPPRLIEAKKVPNTPEQSPSSDISIPSSSGTTRKKVNFELCDLPSKQAVKHSWTPTRSSPLRPLPQTRVVQSLKSILKPSDGTPTPPPADDATTAHKFKSFAEMLESIVKLLASSERSSRLDAYHSLHRTMEAYDKVPGHQALKQKMSLLTQFIQRDVQAPSPTGTGLDSQMIGQATKLLMALFRISDLTSAMDDDFCAFIVERAIRVASDSSIPKTVVNAHLAVLMQQNFRPKIMTVTRVEKLLDALDTIHDRISGNAVQAYRIRIYRSLIKQRPDVMIKHSESWFTHTLKALMSVQKDISSSALETCLTAATSIGHDRHVSRSVLSVLNRTKSDGTTIGSVFAKELVRMLGGDHAPLVPQIWAVVTGLLKDSLHGEMFNALAEWLRVYECCYDSEKDTVRIHSNVAFCFFLYSVNLGTTTNEAWSKMFWKTSLHALQRRTPVKKGERDAVSSAYFTLLYYALRPTASFEQFDRYWGEFVAAVWKPLVQAAPHQHAIPACRVVSALLNGSRKPWNEYRALDLRAQYMIQRAELPLIDPKWVRKSMAQVLLFVEDLLDATLWTETKEPEDEPVKMMWLAVLNSVVEASSKEIMASTETKDAMAQIINLLRRIWDRYTAKLAVPQKKEDIWADKFCFLIESVVQKLGAFQFADKTLTRNGSNEFEVASTPSHRSRNQITRVSPLLYLVDLLVTQSEGKLADPVRLRAIQVIIEPCFAAQNSRLSKLELLRDCATTVDGSLKGAVAAKFWAQIVTLLQTTMQERTSASEERVARPLGKEYDLVVEILSLGSASLLDRPHGHQVLSTFIETVRREAGEGALIIAVIEKVSEFVLKRIPDDEQVSGLSYASLLLHNLPRQMNRKVLDQGRQILWPSTATTGRNPDFDPYIHLYGAIAAVGSAAYQDLDRKDVEPTKSFLAALGSSIQHCSTSHLAVYLRKTQEVLGIWIEDPERKLHSRDEPLKSVHREVVSMWQEVSKAIERLPRRDSQILLQLEALMTAGFLSRRRSIVNISIATWNSTFGKEDTLTYPHGLETALRLLRQNVELSLPSLEAREEDADNTVSFYDSDTATNEPKRAFKSPRVKESPFRIAKSTRRSMSRSPAVPTSARRTSARQTPKARLRHDNSQIDFEPIASSPSNPFNQESQVLTKRQKEMLDRQRLSTGLFSKMGALSPQPEAPSPMEIDSDAFTADDLPQSSQATPLKPLAAMGSMDEFLGSSPTPHTRRSSRHIVRDDTDIATPTAVRCIQIANDDLGSSPPRFEKEEESKPDVLVGSSFAYRQPESSYSASFDEGTTIDEALLDAVARHEHEQMSSNLPSDAVTSELPSSTIDLQLTAQIDADMQPHEEPADTMHESNQEFVDATSHPQSFFAAEDQGGSDTEVDDTQTPTRAIRVTRSSQATASSTSRVDDSFIKSPTKTTPSSLRRSARHSTGGSPAQPPSTKKRKQTPSKKTSKDAQGVEPSISQEPAAADNDDTEVIDNIVVIAPSPERSSRKRKSTHPSPNTRTATDTGTRKKRSLRRSRSQLSQVENLTEDANEEVSRVEDTPVAKRARQSADQDVGDARRSSIGTNGQATQTTPNSRSTTPGSGTKRLSHVQVSPRPASSSSIKPDIDGRPTPTPSQDTDVDVKPSLELEQTHMTNTPSRSFAERVILTPKSIIQQLKSLKDYLFSPPTPFRPSREEEREIDDVMFDIRRQVIAAGVREEEGRRGSSG
ncbi:telomere length regulator rif1 [Pyrenophora seminiperda CCB06]|uniref:Telomere length regulator rif1 n=1 Tax=Pyrenophora seminiperda CCB06 TaxID=1302712 RepID=A0A3M7MJ31_9PLEO|nr:telomere length regulator rif1 [Pyrenophora seminiperda CCB06]